MSKTLCIGSLDYSKGTSLDNQPIVWVRLRLLCEADGQSLWTDKFADINDVISTIKTNDISIYDIVQEDENTFIARSASKSMNELTEWEPNGNNEGLCVRTFYTLLNNNNCDLFNQDSYWMTKYIGNKSIHDWYNLIKRLKSE